MTGLQDRLMLELVSAKQEKHMRFLKNEILDLIKNGESESVEFKKSTFSLRGAIQTICAFANHHGDMSFSVLKTVAGLLAGKSRMIP